MSMLQAMREKRRQQQPASTSTPPRDDKGRFTKREFVLPEGWEDTGRTKKGKKIVRAYAICRKVPTAVEKALVNLVSVERQYNVGDTCNRCYGTGRYSAQLGHFHNGPCYRCNQKGWLNQRDIDLLRKREVNNEPVCDLRSA